MKFILAIFILCTSIYPQSQWWAEASDEQKTSIRQSFEVNKPFDMGFTLAAFNAIESSGGLHLLRIGENSAGLYAQRAVYVAQRVYKVASPTDWQVSRALQRLVTDRAFDNFHARAHLGEMLKQYDGDFMKVWQAWNGRKEGQAEEVRNWVRFLRYELKWR